MSSSVTDPANESATTGAVDTATVTPPNPKGKGKAETTNEPMNEEEEEEEEEDDEDDDDEEEEEEEEEEETFDDIDPSSIVPTGRRTRGVRIDYTSKEALEKAGLGAEEDENEDEDGDVVMS